MKKSKFTSLIKKVSAMMFALIVGLGFVVVPKALASDEDRTVDVGNTTYTVRHDGNGPYIKVMGDKFYLASDQNDKVVIVNGVSYKVHGSDNSDHHRHHDDKN